MKVLTISIAAYNVSEFLKETLESFSNVFNDESIEVIVVNDGSKDNTKEIALAYQRMWPQIIRVINKKNAGWGSTINVALEIANGKYFKELDGDDYFSKINIKYFLDLLENIDADVVYTPYVEFDSETGECLSTYQFGKIKYNFYEEMDFSECVCNLPFTMHACTHKTALLKKNNVKLLENCFYTDKEYILKSALYSKTIYFWDKPIYYYRVARNGQSMSPEGLIRHYQDLIKTTREYIDIYYHYDFNSNIKKLYFDQISNTILMTYYAFYWMEPVWENKNKLIEYDKWVKNCCSEFYEIDNILIRIDRECKFAFYYCIIKLRRIKRKLKLFFK